jgi:hypothetical protein
MSDRAVGLRPEEEWVRHAGAKKASSGDRWSKLRPQARAKRLRRELPELLKSLDLQSVTEIRRPTRHAPRRPEGVLAEALGVVYARQSGTDFPGSIYVTVHQPLDKMAGFVSESGEPLVEWIGTFLRAERQRDVLDDHDPSLLAMFVFALGRYARNLTSALAVERGRTSAAVLEEFLFRPGSVP